MGTGYLRLMIYDGKEECSIQDLTQTGRQVVLGLAKNLIEEVTEIEDDEEEREGKD